jgi:plastocyanin
VNKTLSLLFAFIVGTSLSAPGAEVAGRVVALGRPSTARVTTIVYLESLDGRTPVRPGHYQLTQKNKSFVPNVLAIPAGSTVDFPNQDPIFHNVFTRSSPAPFDLGLYRAGASKSRVFPQPAIYRVFCNIHSEMTAVILVVPTSYIAQTDASGAYHLDVPPGKYRVTAWSERSQSVSTEITVATAAVSAPQLTLDESHYVAVPHLNKFGLPYPATNYDPLKN